MLEIYNTRTRKKELFVSENNKIKLFVCGPTVYDHSHIGHGRTYIAFDLIKTYLEFLGYSVFYIENITDIDDKIIQKSKNEKIEFKELAKFYENEFKKDMEKLNVNSVNLYPKSTDYIDEILDQIQRLFDKGYAYETKKGIYFEVSKFPEFGKLSNQNLKKQKSRLSNEVDENIVDIDKKDSKDFALWKKTDEKPYFKSEWGNGRPGWHIEDTAITEEYFGNQYDIHGGGLDLIFPHHEAEIAQMESLTGKKPMVNYWMHTGFLNVDGVKMSKSLGNFITIKELLSNWDPMVFRLYILSTHYRTPIDFSQDHLYQSSSNLNRLKNTIKNLKDLEELDSNLEYDKNNEIKLLNKLFNVETEFYKYMNDDFNTPRALAILLNFTKVINNLIDEIDQNNKISKPNEFIEKALSFFKDVESIFKLNLFKEDSKSYDDLLNVLIESRNKLREEKNYELSDYIRDKLNEIGIDIEDK